ncbi:MAG TPA: GH116 family glycosyl hydrolase [Fimbriimonadaceae bacterium]|nr:GH116 family glycosyl hydrolase [Fimbriimonadaceae bacterium]
MTRRDFLTATMATAVPISGQSLLNEQASAGDRLTNLLERGVPEVFTGDQLRYIGLPIGGCFAGTVYLGGDGQLWNWDIFNAGQEGALRQPNVSFLGDHVRERDGANYVNPSRQTSPFAQRFDLHTDNGARPNPAIPMGLSVKFGSISFRGEYPIGKVQYRRGDSDVEMDLEAFSPFIPLDIDRSSYPATTMTYTVRNVGTKAERCSLRYKFENPVLCYSKGSRSDFDFQSAVSEFGVSLWAQPKPTSETSRADLVVEDWSSGSYGNWTTTGTSFGIAPRKVSDLPSYMGDVGATGTHVVNSHETRSGEDVVAGDAHVGTLTSSPFLVERDFLNFLVGGGAHVGKTCINVLVDEKIVGSITGQNSNRMSWKSLDLRKFAGKQARVQVVDSERGGWGNIAVGEIVQSDTSRGLPKLEELGDFGSFCVRVVGGNVAVEQHGEDFVVRSDFELQPGASVSVTFFLAWHFPNKPRSVPGTQHWYATKWKSASHVLDDLCSNWRELRDMTRRWNSTWYDSTLPHWFLDRTFANTSTLATTTCYRLDQEGRFYFWEGVGCCPGTCTHVWGYAQAVGRLFPEVEKYLREAVDFGRFLRPDGAIDYRGEFGGSVAHDGQLSCVLRFYREHLMSPDNTFLRKYWSRVKLAIEYMIREDKDQDGILEGAQYNTLDAAWHGPIAWISSLYIACLRAGEAMAKLVGDAEFEAKCRTLAESGSRNMVSKLYDGEYFINLPDPSHRESNNTNIGCHIDQLYGQFWTSQLGLPRVVPKIEGKSAMSALFRNNFYTDVWEYRRKVKGIQGGRWYALPGEPGLIMCTFPKGGSENATGRGQDAWAAAYFNECMSGFEYQAAANMIAEGLVEEGLAVVRAIHDRYHPSKRNPYNEVECSDHYGRAMASFGAYWALCGLHVDSPKKVVTVAPRTKDKRVRCAFIDAHGWGTIDNQSGETNRNYHYRVVKK